MNTFLQTLSVGSHAFYSGSLSASRCLFSYKDQHHPSLRRSPYRWRGQPKGSEPFSLLDAPLEACLAKRGTEIPGHCGSAPTGRKRSREEMSRGERNLQI